MDFCSDGGDAAVTAIKSTVDHLIKYLWFYLAAIHSYGFVPDDKCRIFL